MYADFGTFGLLWILLNLFFLLAMVAGGIVLTTWLAKSRIARQGRKDIQHSLPKKEQKFNPQ